MVLNLSFTKLTAFNIQQNHNLQFLPYVDVDGGIYLGSINHISPPFDRQVVAGQFLFMVAYDWVPIRIGDIK